VVSFRLYPFNWDVGMMITRAENICFKGLNHQPLQLFIADPAGQQGNWACAWNQVRRINIHLSAIFASPRSKI